MLDVRKIRQNPHEVLEALKKRSQNVSIDLFLSQDEQRRALLLQSEEKKALRNQQNKQMGMARKNGASETQISSMMEALQDTGSEIAALDMQIASLNKEMETFLMTLPNLPHPSVPVGSNEESNVEVRRVGMPRVFEWEPKPHTEIRTDLELVSAFSPSVLRGLGARLELSLACFFLDAFSRDGYEETLFPLADASVLEICRNAIFTHDPFCICSCIPASSKMVLNQITSAGQSASALESMVSSVEKAILQLGLSCRITELCTGCLDFSAAQTRVLEVWMPSRKSYVRFADCSDCTDFTARRLDIRFREGAKEKPRAAHIISGSLNIRCVFDAILENFQNDDGTVSVPECLKTVMKTNLICK